MKDGRSYLRRNFHQAKWDEPIIFELSKPGQRGILVPQPEEEIQKGAGRPWEELPDGMRRRSLPDLPQLPQIEVLRHYLRLSQGVLGADINIEIGQGTCTMKYSPKVNEKFAASPKIQDIHPLQHHETVQGVLEIIYKTDLFLRQISGLDRFSFQPGGGSQASFAMASIIRAYHKARGEENQRDEIITTIFSHPSNAAAAAVKGFKVITIYPDEHGFPDFQALKSAVSERTAGLMITNPEDTGVFNPRIKEFTEMVHKAGGLCGYDQANANGILGLTRAKEAGFDMCFFNLHKTFSSPHGCGGPGAGALGVTKELEQFLPVPVVEFDGDRYVLNYDLANSIGKVKMFYGNIPAVVRAYMWIVSLGEEGLKEAAKVAVLNSNYLLTKIKDIRGVEVPYAPGKHRFEQVRYSWAPLTEETGITTEDVQRRMCDFGLHYWTSHHPWIVPEPFTLEPTESASKQDLDEYVEALKEISSEAYENPEIVRRAPHRSVVHKICDDQFDDPEKWAITWRAYVKKHLS
ncbi:MAG TPA: aminomethyl-transferring glycine dehydrogenase subunit GcvPB [Bacillota bacterium]|nr:aminomethyl-transferring glycine dehydrogenase subunit GcvPB [Candidatus Fermentithermobacillaceae bacterium]HOB30117.1 aminomethyl-transferring glycine dehydrogenase subunit GcvPB [Bacillota bacterium]HOK64007.1 aminomethyl-transferring glycine dehydrogenase subunit GcvPB [Bacillota bacterium]HOL11362.1 aminomethyl-transferring glycine dehydrogenase subunit GcvPB [Bacillota bacterium]HOQ02491.1 aminomethyl-transferring glycine dehydrogenase subunit GcvPB [Bacillota bacterium]